MKFNFTVRNDRITRANNDDFVEGNKGFYEAVFDFGKDTCWEEAAKLCVVECGDDVFRIPIIGGSCLLPTFDKGSFKIGVIGTQAIDGPDSAITISTNMITCGVVDGAADKEANAELNTAAEIWEKYLADMENNRKAAEKAAEKAQYFAESVSNMTASAIALPEGSMPTVESSHNGETIHLEFGIPKGDKGERGEQGPAGAKGDKGDSYILTDEDKSEIVKKISGDVIIGKLADVATSGSYNDLKDTPVIPGETGTGFQTEESRAISDYSIAIGDGNIAGAKGYYIKSIDMENKKIYLSDVKVEANVSLDDNTDALFKTPEYDIGDELTILANTNLGEEHLINCTKIVSIANNVIEYSTNLPFSTLEPSDEDDVFPVVFCVSKAGVGSVAVSDAAYAEGVANIAAGWGSHAEGRGTKAVARYAHTEGRATIAGYAAHSEGLGTEALGQDSHTEGLYSRALGVGSHAENKTTTAYGDYSHSEGSKTFAAGTNQHVQGSYNIIDADADGNPLNTYADIVGNGLSDDSRSNAYTLDWGGNGCFAGDVYVNGADMSTGQKLATEEYVNDIVSNISTPEQLYTTYGVSIDLSNSNPETAVTYTDDAVGMIAGSPAWYKMDIFKDIKPCLFGNGVVWGYLNPDDFSQFIDGTVADIYSGVGGDVMIEIPKIGYKITTIGTTLTVHITNDPNKTGFSYKAHTRTEDGDREKLYIGAFLSSYKENKKELHSIAGLEPRRHTSMTTFRNLAKEKGTGYDILSFYPITLLQCLYLIMYKNLDSQAALGQGVVKGTVTNTGGTIYKGMSYGITDKTQQIKFLGIEDFWGNLSCWIDGLIWNGENSLVATDNFNNTGDGYTNLKIKLYDIYKGMRGYMTRPQGNNDAGFILLDNGGSSSTYFPDDSFLTGSEVSNLNFANFGGSYTSDSGAGIFRFRTGFQSNYTSGEVGARLMFL